MALSTKRWGIGMGLAAVLVAGGLWVTERGLDKDRAIPALDPTDAALVAEGAEVYARHCASCHGTDLEGEPNWRERKANGRLPAPPHDPSGHTWHHADHHLFLMTKYGPQIFAGLDYRSDMPAYKNVLSDREIAAVLAYIKSTWPPDILARQQAITERARQDG